jgi:hypothetical protein
MTIDKYDRFLQRVFNYDEIHFATKKAKTIRGFFATIYPDIEIEDLIRAQPYYRHMQGIKRSSVVEGYRMHCVYRVVYDHKEQIELYLL